MKNALILTASISVLALNAQAQTTQTAAVTQAAPSVSIDAIKGTLLRTMSLRDLGYGNGISFSQLSGQTEIYFPVRDAKPVLGGQLTLELDHGATTAVERFLQIKIGGRIATSVGLDVAGGQISLPIDIRPSDIQNGFLTIGLSYSGAFSEFICVDERASGDFVQISPNSSLSLTLDADQITSPLDFNSLRPANVYVQMPESPEMSGLAAAVRAATLFGAEQGGVHFGTAPLSAEGTAWTSSAITLDVTTSGPSSEMRVLRGPQPTLHVRGTDPQLGLWQLSSDWAGVTDAANSVTRIIDSGASTTDAVMMSTLGADLREKQVVSSEQFSIPFQSSSMPTGKTISEVDLVLAAGLSPSGEGASATVYLNDTLLGSKSLERGMPERVKFAVPEGLISRDNLLRVFFQRQASGGQCRLKPQGYSAQILPGSKFNLKDTTGDAEHFFQLRQSFSDGAQIFIDPDLGLSQSDLMPWLGTVAGTLIPDRASIIPRNALTDIDAGMPFVIVSQTNPGDDDPLITMDKGRIEIRDRVGDVIFDGDALERLGIVQIITRNGAMGLWLRPGRGAGPKASEETPFVLDRGDLALIAEDGVIVATSTSKNALIDVVYPDQTSLKDILNQYRPWIVGGLWLALTLFVLAAFQKIYRRRTQRDK
jgi:hypothetical protein